MTVNQILQLDCRESQNMGIIQKELRQIKPLSSVNGKIPMDKLEKLITVISKRYMVRIRDITPDVWSNANNTIWRATIINEIDLGIKQVYGLDLYEVMAKSAICMYSIKDSVGRR